MILKKKLTLIFFLFFYFFVGSTNSINSGISFDENYEELNWNFNIKVIQEISNTRFGKKEFNRLKFDKEVKRFVGYGIGFQLISQPIQFILKDLLKNNKNLDLYGAKLLSKHFVVFLFFFISGIIFYLILRKLIDNENFCILGCALYLTYPYLFGQAMFSPKDVPFMSVWLVCTYISFNLFEKLSDNQKLSLKSIFFLSIMTSYLLSIRISGLLIFIQYSISLLIFLSVFKINFLLFLEKFFKEIILFIFFTILFLFIFYPIFWIDPSLLIETFKINISHFNNVGTNTLGETMYSKNLPVTYLPIWFLVKVPLIILIGLITIPFVENKIFINKKKSIYYGSVLLTILIIPLILILKKVHLYDEIRQVMFLLPLILIAGLVSLFIFSKYLYYLLGVLSLSLFIFENIKINPYQYVWFNIPARYVDLTKNFELEYQGISGREVANYLKTNINQETCILANPLHSVRHFLNDTNFSCFDAWQKIDTNYKRPFLAVQNVRNLKKSTPYKCFSMYEASFKLLFQKKKIITAKLLECR